MSAVGSLSPRRSLYRTLSDESVCSNRKGSSYASSHSSMLDQAMPNDILFSTTPPYHSTLPPRMIHNQGASNLRSEYRQWEMCAIPHQGYCRKAAVKKTNRPQHCLIKIPPRGRVADVDVLCMLLLDYHSSSLASDKSQDIGTCLKSHLCPTNIISTTGTHSSNTPQYSQLIGTGWGGMQLARGLPLHLH